MLILYRGATVSSRGILNAVNNALSQAGATKSQLNVEEISTTNEDVKRNEPVIEQIKKGFKNLKDGEYIGTANGYYSNSIQVKVTVKNNQIFKIDLLKNGDDIQFFNSNKANILSNRIIEKQSTDVDTVSGGDSFIKRLYKCSCRCFD